MKPEFVPGSSSLVLEFPDRSPEHLLLLPEFPVWPSEHPVFGADLQTSRNLASGSSILPRHLPEHLRETSAVLLLLLYSPCNYLLFCYSGNVI